MWEQTHNTDLEQTEGLVYKAKEILQSQRVIENKRENTRKIRG